MKQVFVSYVYEDNRYRTLLENWETSGKIPGVHFTFETLDLRQEGETAVKNHIRPKIKGAAALLLLVGSNTHNHHWVKWEVDVANSIGTPVYIVRLPGTFGAPPAGIGSVPEIAFEPGAISSTIS